MDKDFDFEKDMDFDTSDFLGEDDLGEDIDLSEFSDLDLDSQPPAEEDDLDLGDLDSLLGPGTGKYAPQEEPEDDLFSGEEPTWDLNQPEKEPPEEDFGDEPDFPDGLFGKRASIYQNAPQEQAPVEDYQEPEEYEEPVQEDTEEPQEFDEEQQERPRRERRPRAPREPKPPKERKPNVFTKLFDLYFGPVLNKDQQEQPVDPANPRRRRKKSKEQIFKEVYLPPIIACVALILMMAFVIGAISSAIDRKRLDDQQKQLEIEASISQAEEQDAEYKRVLNKADELALSYDFQGAIDALDAFPAYDSYPNLATKRAEYVTARDSMVEYKDPSQLPNLSFHPLIVDTARAFSDKELGGKYNQNFVTVGEFQKILDQLYSNGYVLVDFNSFVGTTQTVSGEEQFQSVSISLPSGKKPIMLTETMMGYYEYMVDPDKDGTPDAKGAGFANKLVVDDYGNIQAAYVDANGQSLVGSYDLVPILEDFIAQHPDFSYQGARAILATTGDEGIYGYRCNTNYVGTRTQDYYDREKADAITLVNALRQKGYTLACYSYKNENYRKLNTKQITADLSNWTAQITPIIGDVDVFVYAQGTDLSEYGSSASFKAMYATGFRYYIASGKSPSTTINNTYVHQNRLMVTGETMCWYADRFKDLFDCNLVLDLAARGDVPKAA